MLVSFLFAPFFFFLCCSFGVTVDGMTLTTNLTLTTRTQRLQSTGRVAWSTQDAIQQIDVTQLAVVVVDMWDKHWCPSATERVGALAVLINETITAARNMGVTVIHAPSTCSSFYSSSPARLSVLSLPDSPLPSSLRPLPIPFPNFPIDASNKGCDVFGPDVYEHRVWTREIDTIYIDEERDYIIDDERDGQTMWNILQEKKINTVIYMGVHENMCIMNRTFAIVNAYQWGLNVGVFREVVDTMYSPALSPYVSHDEGTQLMTAYVEKFWAFSTSIYDIINPRV